METFPIQFKFNSFLIQKCIEVGQFLIPLHGENRGAYYFKFTPLVRSPFVDDEMAIKTSKDRVLELMIFNN